MSQVKYRKSFKWDFSEEALPRSNNDNSSQCTFERTPTSLWWLPGCWFSAQMWPVGQGITGQNARKLLVILSSSWRNTPQLLASILLIFRVTRMLTIFVSFLIVFMEKGIFRGLYSAIFAGVTLSFIFMDFSVYCYWLCTLR